ncbi:transposase [Streptomyces sp. NPDC056721]|uniref:transposase n=1 Tax=unclassified Streptomyces TaxID=2593676 RepID=UPI0036A27D84
MCDGRGTPLKVVTTAANVNDVTQALTLVDGIPPIASSPSRPRRRPKALLGDKGYDSDPNREEQRRVRRCPRLPQRESGLRLLGRAPARPRRSRRGRGASCRARP